MTEKDFQREFSALPPEARKQVADFMAFLRDRIAPVRLGRQAKRLKPLDKEPFFGMWKDRDDMNDSAEWVREIRKREWHERAN